MINPLIILRLVSFPLISQKTISKFIHRRLFAETVWSIKKSFPKKPLYT